MRGAPRVAACLVHHGDPRLVQGVVDQLARQSEPPHAVVVVDNGPGGPPDLRSTLPLSVIGSGVNRGYAGGINAAARWARDGGYAQLWVLNTDVTLAPSALHELRHALADHPEADVAGSVITSGSAVWFAGGRFDPGWGRAWHEGFGDDAASRRWDGAVVPTDWVNGCSMLLRLAALERRGPFDEHLFLYREELDWQVRWPAAHAVLVRSPLVDHGVGLSTGSTDGHLGRLFMARNGLLLALRQPPLLRLRWLAAWAVEVLALPLAHGQVRQVWWALEGVRARRTPGADVVAGLS